MSISNELTRYETLKQSYGVVKENIKNAIIEKGGTVSDTDGFTDFADDIASIPQGGGGESFEITLTSGTVNAEQFYNTIIPYLDFASADEAWIARNLNFDKVYNRIYDMYIPYSDSAITGRAIVRRYRNGLQTAPTVGQYDAIINAGDVVKVVKFNIV